MNVYPINTNRDSKSILTESKETKIDLSVALPANWWQTATSYTQRSEIKENTARDKKTNFSRNLSELKNIHGNWSVKKGDHRVKEPYKKDYVYYRELKNKMLKYSVYPAMFLVIALVYFASNILSNL